MAVTRDRLLSVAIALLFVEAIYVGGTLLLLASMEATMSAFEGLDANYVLVTTILGVGISVAVGLAWSALTLRNVRRGRPPTRVAAALLWIVAAANLVLTTAYALRSLPVMRDAPQWFGPAEYGWVIGGWVAVLFITSVTAKTLVSVPRQSSSSR